MSFWEGFNRYVGIQGIIAVGLVCAYVYAALVVIVLPEGFTEIMTLVIGFYFAKNGGGIITALRRNP